MKEKSDAKAHINPVLLVDDNLDNLEIMNRVCVDIGLDMETATNGRDALDKIRLRPFSLYVLDLNMPVMDGISLIKELNLIDPEAVIIVNTVVDSPDTIIELMKMGVHEYIIKPIDVEIFQRILYKSLEYRHLKDMEKNLIQQSAMQLRGQLEWLTYKESRRHMGKDSEGKVSISNLRHSLSQGGGLGTLVSLIDMMTMYGEENGDKICFEKDIVNLIVENNNTARKNLEGLEAFVSIMDRDLSFEQISVKQLFNEFPEMLHYIADLLTRKNMTLLYSEVTRSFSIKVDRGLFAVALEELVINAYKYGKRNAAIEIYVTISEGYVIINVKNEIAEDDLFQGISEEYERLVVEPFFRLHPPVEETVDVERVGIGLGLTAVKYIVNQHNGQFFINNIDDHTGKNIVKCVLSRMYFPVSMEE